MARAVEISKLYKQALDNLGIKSGDPYNVVLAKDWMVIVKRKNLEW